MINTEKGLNIFCKVRCNFKKWLLSEEQSIQPCLERPTKVNLNRNKFWKYYERYGFKKSYFYFFTDGKYVKIKKRVKAVLKDSFMFFSNK